jgi:hypothetical protein
VPATQDGRCWPCVQRRRWYTEQVTQADLGGLRHYALGGQPLCQLPRRERHREPAVQRAYRQAYDARRRAANPEGFTWWRRHRRYGSQLRRAYGIGWPDWEALYVAQGGRCACCWSAPATEVDHCHTTSRVRGLLCEPCNLMLGHAKDDAGRLAAAIDYLSRP